MNIPQVNAQATDRNREQTKTIVELLGYTLFPWEDYSDGTWKVEAHGALAAKQSGAEDVFLSNGSFTLCQVVGMLKERGWQFHPRDVRDYKGGYWMKRRADMVWQDLGYIKDVHSLTENADSLIKLLELKL